jgi:hypothetical protein
VIRVVAAVAALLTLTLSVAPTAYAAATVDVRAEVAAALYAASATQEAVERAADGRLGAAQSRIAALKAKVLAGQAERAQLIIAQQDFVSQLAARDRAYAEAIGAFRGSVVDIASTPAGAAALAEFNAGNEAGALAVLDKLQAADEAALQKDADVETAIKKAVGERRIAQLAFDAYGHGNVDIASVIERFEALTRLDPGEYTDWITLSDAYKAAGRDAEAKTAAVTATHLAVDELDRWITWSHLSYLLDDLSDPGRDAARQEVSEIERQLASGIDPHLEIATALYGASATQQAEARHGAPDLQALKARIATLANLAASGEASQRPALAAAEDDYVANLAKSDHVYAQQIDAFRPAVTAIASTPEGDAALARFNAGNQTGSLFVLEYMRTAAERTGQKRLIMEKARTERLIADLAFRAWSAGKVTTESVIARYRAITQLDPDEASDWVALSHLYGKAGQGADALVSARTAVAKAKSDQQQSRAIEALGDALFAQKDLRDATEAYEKSAAIEQSLVKAHPDDADLKADLANLLQKIRGS